jgi:hypothetical protein
VVEQLMLCPREIHETVEHAQAGQTTNLSAKQCARGDPEGEQFVPDALITPFLMSSE